MTAHSPVSSCEKELEDALRDLCNLMTKLQHRAARYLPYGDADEFINDTLELLDGPEQRRIQGRARALLNEAHVQVPLRRPGRVL